MSDIAVYVEVLEPSGAWRFYEYRRFAEANESKSVFRELAGTSVGWLYRGFPTDMSSDTREEIDCDPGVKNGHWLFLRELLEMNLHKLQEDVYGWADLKDWLEFNSTGSIRKIKKVANPIYCKEISSLQMSMHVHGILNSPPEITPITNVALKVTSVGSFVNYFIPELSALSVNTPAGGMGIRIIYYFV